MVISVASHALQHEILLIIYVILYLELLIWLTSKRRDCYGLQRFIYLAFSVTSSAVTA